MPLVRAKKLLEVIHSDVCGPMQTATFGGSRYFFTFIDEYSHMRAVFIPKRMSKVASKFVDFFKFADTWTKPASRYFAVITV